MASASAGQPDPEIVDRLRQPDKYGGAFTVARWIMKRLEELKLLFELVLPPSSLGMHPCNRGTYGANEESTHSLLADIFDVGWNPEEIVAPLAAEEDPNDRYIEKCNEAMTKVSPFLAPVVPMSIRAGTLTNGHLVLGLRALLAGVATSQSTLAVDGHLSLAHVQAKDPDMARAAVDGWTWKVIHHSCRKLYGDSLYEMLSDVKNIKLARAESEVQVMNKIANMASNYQKQKQSIAWDHIHSAVCRTKPACQNYVSAIISFVKHYSGGIDVPFVVDFVRFHRRFVPHERFVGGPFYEFLGSFVCRNKKTESEIPAPLARWAFLKAQYGSPECRVVNRECQFLTRGDMEALVRKSPEDLFEVEAILAKSRELAQDPSLKLSIDDQVMLFGKLDQTLVRVICKKQQHSKVKFESIKAAASEFYRELKEIAPSMSTPNPWHLNVAASSTDSPAIDIRNDMRAFSSTGALIGVDAESAVKNYGFKVGALVTAKSGNLRSQRCTLVGFSDSVEIEDPDGNRKSIDVRVFLEGWALYEEEFLPFGDGSDASTHELFEYSACKGAITSALRALSVSVPKPQVQIQTKPIKRIICDGTYKKGELVLVPSTMAIAASRGDQDPPKSSVEVEIECEQNTSSYVLTPPTMTADIERKSLVAPLWAVRPTHKAKLVNMEWAKTTVENTIKPAIGTMKSKTMTIGITIMRNTTQLQPGDELFVYKRADNDSSSNEGDNKPPDVGGKGRGRGKAKAKAPATKAKAPAPKRQRKA